MGKIRELEVEIRAFINDPRKQNKLLKQTASWNQLCSCLDLVGDTELAIEAYLNSSEPQKVGEKYLLIYGVLQALFLQQDAVKYLAEALEIEYLPNSLLAEVREVRNDSTGHPTKRGGGRRVQTSSFISRHSLSLRGFTLMKTYSDDRPLTFVDINIPDVIRSQQQALAEVLAEFIERLRAEEMEHRRKYRDQKLEAIFPETISYYFEKIGESVYGSKSAEFGTIHVNLIIEIVEKFKQALADRGVLEAYQGVTYELDRVVYSLEQLREHFLLSGKSRLSDRDADIFLDFTARRIEALQRIARGIDDEYKTDV